MKFIDQYPTRMKKSREPLERLDPVVYSKIEDENSGPLTSQQLRQYQSDGYLFLNSFVAEKTVDTFLDELKEYEFDEEIKRLDQTITEPGSDEIRSIFGIHNLSKNFDRLVREPIFLDLASQILNSDVYIHQSRLNDKPKFTGTGFNWHSDFETWHSEDGMPRMRCFSLSLLLTENNPLNGPLMLIPGSHRYFVPIRGNTPQENWKQSLKAQTIGVPDPAILEQLTDEKGIVAPSGPKGSLILFDCNTLHASTGNLSPWSRRNLFFVYNSVGNQLFSPFCGNKPRPEFVAAREKVKPLKPHADTLSRLKMFA